MKRRPGARWVPTLRARMFLVASAAALACSCSSPHRSQRERTSLVEGARLVAPAESKSSWRYHPREAGDVLSVRDLPGEQRLFTSTRGERWLVQGADRRIQVADTLASEALIASSERNGRWIFVGASGTTYEATTALGDFVRTTPPAVPLRRVAAASGHLLGISADGHLLHSGDTGESWHAVGSERRFVDVEITPSLNALALSIPEQLHLSEDAGQTWRALPESPKGASDLSKNAFSKTELLEVRTAFGVLHFNADRGVLEPPAARRAGAAAVLPAISPSGPSAAALRDFRAGIWGNRYYELLETNGRWELLFGELGRALERRGVPELSGCVWTRITAGRTQLVVACGRREMREGSSAPLDLLFSGDNGSSWQLLASNVFGQAAELRLAVQGSRLFVTGVCAPENAGAGCLPAGVYSTLLKSTVDPTRAHLEPARLPALRGAALALVSATSQDGVYVVGRRTKNNKLVVYVPTALAKWEPRELSDLASDIQDDVRITATVQAADGTLALVVRPTTEQQSALVLIDQGARVLSVTSAPGHTLMAAQGSLALAVDPVQRGTWESVNGGVTWQPRGMLPLAMCEKSQPCDFSLFCYQGGCVVGDALSRQGWQRSLNALMEPLAAREATQNPALERKVRTPIVCDVTDPEWTSLGSLTSLPGAEQAKLGTAAWFALRLNLDEASVAMLEAPNGAPAEVKETVLIAPSTSPHTQAVFASVQVEGGAALRLQLASGNQPAPRSAEVAWRNLVDPMLGRGLVPTTETLGSDDTTPTPYAARLAQPDLISVAQGGVYVRPYASRPEQPLYFLNGRTARLVPSPAWPVQSPAGRDEMLRVDGRDLFVRFLSDGAGMLRAVRQTEQWDFSAMSVALYNPAEWGVNQAVDLTYSAGAPALQIIASGSSAASADGHVYPIQAQGAVFGAGKPVPTQLDVPDALPVCTVDQVTSTPRVVAPFVPGARHPVIVSAGLEPLRVLATEGAVLHGTKEQACLRALDGRLPRKNTQRVQEERVLIDRDDMGHSWLFRVAREDRVVVEYRRMSCQLDPEARVPEEIFALSGTMVPASTPPGAPTQRKP